MPFHAKGLSQMRGLIRSIRTLHTRRSLATQSSMGPPPTCRGTSLIHSPKYLTASWIYTTRSPTAVRVVFLEKPTRTQTGLCSKLLSSILRLVIASFRRCFRSSTLSRRCLLTLRQDLVMSSGPSLPLPLRMLSRQTLSHHRLVRLPSFVAAQSDRASSATLMVAPSHTAVLAIAAATCVSIKPLTSGALSKAAT